MPGSELLHALTPDQTDYLFDHMDSAVPNDADRSAAEDAVRNAMHPTEVALIFNLSEATGADLLRHIVAGFVLGLRYHELNT